MRGKKDKSFSYGRGGFGASESGQLHECPSQHCAQYVASSSEIGRFVFVFLFLIFFFFFFFFFFFSTFFALQEINPVIS
jgi:hypothetical protein